MIVNDILTYFSQTGTITLGSMVLRKAWVPNDLNDPFDKGKLFNIESGTEYVYFVLPACPV